MSNTEDLSWFFSQVKNIKTLTAAEERELIIASQCGSRDARQKLTWHNIPLIIKEATTKAKKHRPASTHYEEILLNAIQEGVIGLGRAIEEFDVSRGFRLSTFAVHYIRDAVNKVLRFDISAVKPVRTLDKARNNDHFIAVLSSMPHFDKEAEQPKDHSVPDAITHTNMLVRLRESLTKLSNEEKYILERRYGFYEDAYTYGGLAKLLKISMERVRQIENGALKKLFIHMNKDELRRFLDTRRVGTEEDEDPNTQAAPVKGAAWSDSLPTLGSGKRKGCSDPRHQQRLTRRRQSLHQ